MNLDSGINLITSTLDLQLVRLLRAATADDAALAAGVHRRPEPQSEILARKRIDPSPRFEPRPVIHPTPRFEPRPVITPSPADAPPSLDRACATARARKSVLPLPVWKTLPSEIPSNPSQTIKLVFHRPDIISKGSLIDLFI